jgi:hypothetical protein
MYRETAGFENQPLPQRSLKAATKRAVILSEAQRNEGSL